MKKRVKPGGVDVRTAIFCAALLLAVCGCPASAMEPGLAHIRRIYVEPLGRTQAAEQMRDMIITALENSRLFMITDDEEKADAKLRGSADDKVYTEEHITSDSVGIHANLGSGGSSNNSMGGGVSSHSTIGSGINDSESSHIQERKHEASASIRLVNEEGDVIWSTTQESPGGKFRSAMADVADKIARQLSEDMRKARQPVDPGK
jgi:hypothetical protein